ERAFVFEEPMTTENQSTADLRAADLIAACSAQTEDVELQAGAQKAAELGGTLADHRTAIAQHGAFEERLLRTRQTISERSKSAADEISRRELSESGDVLKWAQGGGDGSPPVDAAIERLHLEASALNRAVEFGAVAQRGAAKKSAELATQEQSIAAEFETAVASLLDMV